MNIFKEVKNLGFPLRKYVVVGGGVMTAHKIRETDDIDIVVTKDLFEKCEQSGWEEKLRPNGEKGLKKGIVEIYLNVNCGNFNPSTKYLIDNADIIDGVPFIRLEDLIRFKKEYGRDKDKEHIKMIKGYLKK